VEKFGSLSDIATLIEILSVHKDMTTQMQESIL